MECAKCGVWKMRGVEMSRKFQFSVSISHSNAEKQCVNNKKKRKTKKRYTSLHFKMRRAGMVIGVVEVCTVH